jgi:glycosyltransferase involved in cell wall biosynthesis
LDSLVSVIIATYNSSSYVVETLESVLNQTWKELELIITDDCSSDNSVELCQEWLIENQCRFVRTKILSFEKNTGIAANANRGLHAAKGIWIKFLGADDTLKPSCIEDNVSWITSHDGAKVLFSRIEIYKNKFDPQFLIQTTPGVPYDQNGILAPERSAESQYKMLLISDRIHYTPSIFLHRDTLLSLGGFDEKYRMLEDYPLWIKLTRKGHKLHFMDKVTVNYRRHSKAINNTGKPCLINPNYFKTEGFRKEYTYPYLPADIRLNERFIWYVSQIFRFNYLNRNVKAAKLLLEILTIYLNPFKYYIRFRKLINKDLRNNEFYAS